MLVVIMGIRIKGARLLAVLVPCNFNNDYKKIVLNKFEDNDYKQPYIVKFVIVHLSNAVL